MNALTKKGPIERAIIVGGGIGGLCSAIALRQMGIEPVVYEQAERLIRSAPD